MIDPKGRNDKSDIPKNKKRQPLSTQNSVGLRLIDLLASRDFGWLSRETGIPVSTLSDYVQRGISKTANAVKIASALGVTVDHLVTGVGAAGEVVVAVASASTAEWEEVPLFDLQSSANAGKGRPLPPVPLRKDWLNRALGETEGIWLANLPSDYAAADLREGDVIFCKDARLPDLVAHALYIWRADGSLFLARYQPLPALERVGDRVGERYVTKQLIGAGEGEAMPLARIVAIAIQKIG